MKLPSALPPLPLYDQPPISPFTSPETSTPPPLPRSPSAALNGEHKPPPAASSHKGPLSTHSKLPGGSHSLGGGVENQSLDMLMTPLSLGSDQTSGRSPVSPGFTQPLRFTPEGGAGKLRPVSIAVAEDPLGFKKKKSQVSVNLVVATRCRSERLLLRPNSTPGGRSRRRATRQRRWRSHWCDRQEKHRGKKKFKRTETLKSSNLETLVSLHRCCCCCCCRLQWGDNPQSCSKVSFNKVM